MSAFRIAAYWVQTTYKAAAGAVVLLLIASATRRHWSFFLSPRKKILKNSVLGTAYSSIPQPFTRAKGCDLGQTESASIGRKFLNGTTKALKGTIIYLRGLCCVTEVARYCHIRATIVPRP